MDETDYMAGCHGHLSRLAAMCGELAAPATTYCPSFQGLPAPGGTDVHTIAPMGYDQPSEHTDLSPEKARKILHDGTAQGHPLTEKQRGFFGAVAGHAEHNSAYAQEAYADHRIRMDDREWEEWKRRHPESVAPYAADPHPFAYAANSGHTAVCGQCGQQFYVHSNQDNAVCPSCGASAVSYRMPVPSPDDDDMVAACRYMTDTLSHSAYAVAPGYAPPPAVTPADYAAYGYYAAYAEMTPAGPVGVED